MAREKEMRTIGKIKSIAVGVIVFGFVAALPMASIAAKVESIHIVGYGLYKTEFNSYMAAPGTSKGKIEALAAADLIQQTERIPATAGTGFGISYVINGQNTGKKVKLLVKVLHPQMQSSQQWVIERQVGTPSFEGWKFDSEFPLTHGRFTIQLFHDGTKMAEKHFTIY